MRRLTQSILTVFASLVLVSPLYASEFSSQAPGTTYYHNPELKSGNTDEISQQSRIGLTTSESANQLLGMPVVARDGENIGEVADMRIDTRTGQIDYVVVEQERGFGIESSFVPVPLGAITFTGQNARLVVDKSKLENVPNPATLSERQFQETLNIHYGIAPTWQEERTIIHQEERKTLRP